MMFAAKLALLFVVTVVVSVHGFAPPAMKARVAYNTELNGAFDMLTKKPSKAAAVVEKAPVKVVKVKKNPFAKKVKEAAAPVMKEAKVVKKNPFAKKEKEAAPVKKESPAKKNPFAKKEAPAKKVAPVKKVVAAKKVAVVAKKAAPVKK
ncbi:hypothetical protein FRACYDRAFT_272256, partial [Fragilariopsis cylindrus CCMP1102]